MNHRCSRAAGAAAFVLAVVAVAFDAAASAAASGCRAADSETIVRNDLARVYEVRGRHYLCTYRTGRSLRLDPPAEDLDIDRVDRMRLNGRFLAYQRVHVVFRGSTTFTIEVRDVRTRKLLRTVNAAPPEGATRTNSSRDGVRDLAVTRGGALAWIVQNPFVPGPRLQVRRADAAGEALLDDGDAIVPASLELRATRVKWRNGRSIRSASLREG